MLRVKLLALGLFAALVMGVAWLWTAGVSEPAVSVPVATEPGSLPDMNRDGAAPGQASSASHALQSDIWAGVHQPPGSKGDDPQKRYHSVTTQDTSRVQRALAGGEPADALFAAQLLTRCARSDQEVQGLFEARDQQPWILAKLGLTVGLDKLIENAQTFQRGCQVFDAAAHAQTGALFQQAFEGGVANSAVPYLRWLQRDGADAPSAVRVVELQRQIRAEAEAADFGTLMLVALTNDPEGLGLNAVEKAGFARAWQRTQDADLGSTGATQAWGPLLKVLALFGDKPPELTPAQEAQAEALAQRVFAAWQRRKQGLS